MPRRAVVPCRGAVPPVMPLVPCRLARGEAVPRRAVVPCRLAVPLVPCRHAVPSRRAVVPCRRVQVGCALA